MPTGRLLRANACLGTQPVGGRPYRTREPADVLSRIRAIDEPDLNEPGKPLAGWIVDYDGVKCPYPFEQTKRTSVQAGGKHQKRSRTSLPSSVELALSSLP